MNHVEAPALLAYKGGDVFATIVDILKQLPDGRDCSPSSLEHLLIQYVLLGKCSTFAFLPDHTANFDSGTELSNDSPLLTMHTISSTCLD